jgi:hypothetical protein
VSASVTPAGEARRVSSAGDAGRELPSTLVRIARLTLPGLRVRAASAGGARRRSMAGNIDSDGAISEDGKNPSTLDRALGAGSHWIAGYSDLARR